MKGEDRRGDKLRLADIQVSLRRIIDYTKSGREAFLASPETPDAVVRNLEVIGEAAGKVSKPVRWANPQVEWRKLRGVATSTKHEHWNIDPERLWAAVVEVPTIERAIVRVRADRVEREN
jgi:uncharacterized protein with HEPN domain